MKVELTPDQEALIKQAVKNGRLKGKEDAIQEALSLWEEEERRRVELLAALDESEADLKGRRYSDYTHETLPTLAVELKREARTQRARRRG